MAPPTRPPLYIPLPSVEYHYNDTQLPKTPDQQDEQQSAVGPPPPPRPVTKVKKKRAGIAFPVPDIGPDPDTVIPTIEMSQPVSEASSPVTAPTQPMDGLLSPLTVSQRLYTPPSTPAAQVDMFASYGSPTTEWAMINDSRDQKQAFQRADSVYSGFSDSSNSSAGSSGFSVPIGESHTSPDSEAFDLFAENDITKADGMAFTPRSDVTTPSNKRVKTTREVTWILAMDKHLENTYMKYLRDPTVTPFKTLPGSAPPLGVCHRVAAKAKRTWAKRQHRASTPTQLDTILESAISQREGSPDTIRPDGNTNFKRIPRWPRSEGATRRRLRHLVKSKPELSAHYQRLLRTRSPSPFTSSSSIGRSSELPAPSFSSSDMKLSLITSTAPSMQPEGPLAKLANEDAMEQGETQSQSQRASRPDNWFGRISRAKAEETSRAVQSGLGAQTDAAKSTGLLASPFDEDASSRSHLLHSMSTTKSLGRNKFQRQNSKVPSLDSPFEMPVAPSLPRSLKRRFKSDEEKPRRSGLQDVFGPPAEEVSTVRHRGFSMGAVRATGDLNRIFVPTEASSAFPISAYAGAPADASADHEMTEAPAVPHFPELGPVGSHSAPRRLAEPVPRLGSPFTATGTSESNRQSNTFPRSYIPTLGNPQPFSDRLRQLAEQGRRN